MTAEVAGLVGGELVAAAGDGRGERLGADGNGDFVCHGGTIEVLAVRFRERGVVLAGAGGAERALGARRVA